MGTSRSVIEEIADAIRKYLETHPNASDSVRGIRCWWLASRAMEVSQENVHEALERLVSDGVIRRAVLADGKVVYGLPARRRRGRRRS